MKALAERERPRTLDDMAGQSEAVDAVRGILTRSGGHAGGRAWFVSGASGTGKTTLARILASTVAGAAAIEESNGADLTVDDIRRMEHEFRYRALARDGDPTGRAWIINEAHLIRGLSLSRFLTTLEPEEGLPSHVTVIFTTTSVGQARMFGDNADASPLVSRCVEVRLANDADSRKERALWVRAKAVEAGIDGFPPETYVAAMDAVQGNTRMLAQRVEAGQLGKTASHEMPVAAPKPVKVAKLPSEVELRAMTGAQLRPLCLEQGFAPGWAMSASVSAMLGKLLAKGAK